MSHYLIAHIGHTNKYTEHVTWWKHNSRGYTFDIEKAGLYDLERAAAICTDGVCIAVSKLDAKAISRATPYYRKFNGDLARLYDGGDLVVVPNSKEAWKALMAARISPDRHADKPTPIGAKARAIYLPAKEKP